MNVGRVDNMWRHYVTLLQRLQQREVCITTKRERERKILQQKKKKIYVQLSDAVGSAWWVEVMSRVKSVLIGGHERVCQWIFKSSARENEWIKSSARENKWILVETIMLHCYRERERDREKLLLKQIERDITKGDYNRWKSDELMWLV